MHETIGVEARPVKGPNVYDVKLSRRYLQKSIASLQRHCPYLHHCHPGKVEFATVLGRFAPELWISSNAPPGKLQPHPFLESAVQQRNAPSSTADDVQVT